jgi:sulfur-carrier protein
MAEGEPTVRVWLPRALQEQTGGEDTHAISGTTLADVIARLNARYPGLGYKLLNDQGHMRRFVLVFVNEEPVTNLEPAEVRLRDGDTVHFIPSVAGG